ncbi:MAG: hypothetical protein ACRENS_05000, partial [Candidatus Eiseniibacteriota bacterium]
SYPSRIVISDQDVSCLGSTNFHMWSMSDDGSNETAFPNNSAFSLDADLVIDGPTDGEGGLRLAPWWSPNTDGLFNCRTTDGEIACFGGRLPFYSFTATNGLHYVKGTSIHLSIEYHQNGLSALTPATIQYTVIYGGNTYSSGRLNFDQGNPAEDPPHGQWGCLNDGFLGGQFKAYGSQGVVPAGLTATWSNINFQNLDSQPVPTHTSSWGKIKALYR